MQWNNFYDTALGKNPHAALFKGALFRVLDDPQTGLRKWFIHNPISAPDSRWKDLKKEWYMNRNANPNYTPFTPDEKAALMPSK